MENRFIEIDDFSDGSVIVSLSSIAYIEPYGEHTTIVLKETNSQGFSIHLRSKTEFIKVKHELSKFGIIVRLSGNTNAH